MDLGLQVPRADGEPGQDGDRAGKPAEGGGGHDGDPRTVLVQLFSQSGISKSYLNPLS